LIERSVPAGALEALDAAAKERFDRTNASVGVRWIQSYANAQQARTFCVYEGASEAATQLNGLPVDGITEVPVTLLPNWTPQEQKRPFRRGPLTLRSRLRALREITSRHSGRDLTSAWGRAGENGSAQGGAGPRQVPALCRAS
jgi:hypothetical protein